MKKKGAIGLSMNVLVVIIISLVILGMGVTMLYSFIGGATDIKTKLDAKTDAELERLLVNQGKMVALPLHVADVERGDTHLFGIGIMNVGDVSGDFYIKVEPSKAFNEDGDEISTSDTFNWFLFNDEAIHIQEGDHVKESIAVIVPKDAAKGQYLFSARVYTDSSYSSDNQYDNKQNFIVNVI
jgi:hypothetical protein